MARARRSWAVGSLMVGKLFHSESVEGVGRWRVVMVAFFPQCRSGREVEAVKLLCDVSSIESLANSHHSLLEDSLNEQLSTFSCQRNNDAQQNNTVLLFCWRV